MTIQHDFVTDLAALLRPLVARRSVYSQLVHGAWVVRVDGLFSGSLWRFDPAEGFVFCGDTSSAPAHPEQTDDWFSIETDIGRAMARAGWAKDLAANCQQEGGWEHEAEKMRANADLARILDDLDDLDDGEDFPMGEACW